MSPRKYGIDKAIGADKLLQTKTGVFEYTHDCVYAKQVMGDQKNENLPQQRSDQDVEAR